jgi:hypothetical protein
MKPQLVTRFRSSISRCPRLVAQTFSLSWKLGVGSRRLGLGPPLRPPESCALGPAPCPCMMPA